MTPHGVLFDLLMAVMNSMAVWEAAAGDRRRAHAWRDAVTARVAAAGAYAPYETLVEEAATTIGLPRAAASDLLHRWTTMEPWPDARAIGRLTVPYGFVTNCSAELAVIAASRSGLEPRLVLSAEEAGRYKPDPQIYREACRRLGTKPAQTAFVAGSPYDADGAQAAGLRAWLVRRRPMQRPSTPSIPIGTSLEDVLAEVGRTGTASAG